MDIKLKLLSLLIAVSSSHSINLNCTNGHIEFKVPGVLSCIVKEDLVIHNENEIVNITGIENVTNIQGFGGKDKEIFYIPQGIGTFFTDLRNVRIRNSSLKEITSENLQEFPKLIYLDLSYNHIKILDKDVFQHNKDLKYIYLNDNKIFAIESTTFNKFKESQPNHKTLTLQNNNCGFKKDENVTTLVSLMDEKCWNETSKIKYDIYKNQRKLEKIESKIANQTADFKDNNAINSSLSAQIQKLKGDIENMKNTHFEDEKLLNESINDRIKRSVGDLRGDVDGKISQIQTNIEKNNETLFKKFHTLSEQFGDMKEGIRKIKELATSEQVENVNNAVNNLHEEIQNIKSNLSEMNELITTASSNQAKIIEELSKNLSSLRQDHNTGEAIETSAGFYSIILEYLNTILLIIILTVQLLVILCNKSRPKPQHFETKPPSIDPIYYTTATQIHDEYPMTKAEQRRKVYESFDDIQSYESNYQPVVNNEAQVHKNNPIYGINESHEDLYMEVISPKTKQSKENIDEVYAVVNKSNRDY